MSKQNEKVTVCCVCGRDLRDEKKNPNIKLYGHLCEDCLNTLLTNVDFDRQKKDRDKSLKELKRLGLIDQFYEGLERLRKMSILLPDFYFNLRNYNTDEVNIQIFGDCTIQKRMAGVEIRLYYDKQFEMFRLCISVAHKQRADKDTRGLALYTDLKGKLKKSKWIILEKEFTDCPEPLFKWLKTIKEDDKLFIDSIVWDKYIPKYDWI